MDSIEHLNEIVREYFLNARSAAHALLEDLSSTEAQLKEGWQNLADAMHMLSFTSDKTALAALVEQAQQLDASHASAQAREELEAAIEFAQAVLEDPKSLDEQSIKEAADRLQAAIDAIEQTESLDCTLLQMLVDAVSGLDGSLYTPASWAPFEAALEEAGQVLANPENQQQVDAMVGTLHEAWLELRLKPSEALLKELAALQQELAEMAGQEAYSAMKSELIAMEQRIGAAIADENLDVFTAQTVKEEGEALIASARSAVKASAASAERTTAASVKTSAATSAAGWMTMLAAGLLGALKLRKKK